MKFKNLGLYTDYYELTMAQGYYLKGRKDTTASFDYFFRSNPFGGGYTVLAGIDDFLELLNKFTFGKKELDYLRKQGFKESFLSYLEDFKFQGDIYACQEGEIVFPHEPVIRVEGNIIETQLIETLLLNIINFSSLIATKASRIKYAAGEKKVIDFGLRRAQGFAGIQASKAAIIGGVEATSNVFSAQKYDLPASGTQAHSWIQSYDNELSAFRDFAKLYPKNCVLLVDTYDTLKSGIPNAIKVAKEMEKKGDKLLGIRLDSGDLIKLSKKARQMLNQAGLEYVKIAVSGQLDEYKIKDMLAQQAPVDVFGVGTRLITGQADAALNGVYKLATIDNKPTLKISEERQKMILPGKKEIVRCQGTEFNTDLIILSSEKKDDLSSIKEVFHISQDKKTTLDCHGREKLLKKIVAGGEKIISTGDVKQAVQYCQKRLSRLANKYKKLKEPEKYQVHVSQAVKEQQQKLINNYMQKN